MKKEEQVKIQNPMPPVKVHGGDEQQKSLKKLMRQLSEQKPIMDGRGSLMNRYVRIVCVVTLYWYKITVF